MSSVDINRLKGNYAESMVTAWLSRVCLVRPVAAGTDIGIDLYCESIIDGTPFLHFWVQVKAIGLDHISSENGKSIAWCDFDTNHLRYWQRQPIPVYAFLVPVDNWPPMSLERIYTIRITEQLTRNGIPDQKQLRLKTSEWADLNAIDDDLTQLITKIVPWDTSVLLLQKGIIAPIPELYSSKEKAFTRGIGYRYLEKISEAIRDTATVSLLSSIELLEAFFKTGIQLPNVYALHKQFEAVTQVYESSLSPLGISALFHAARVDNRFDTAHQYIQRAINRVAADSKLSPEEKADSIASLNNLLNDLI